MNSGSLLTYYCTLILLASIFGGMIPVWFRLTHRWMEISVSFVAGVMLGIGLLHMIPHALANVIYLGAQNNDSLAGAVSVLQWVLVGIMSMFFIERFFCFHHHDVDQDEPGAESCDSNAKPDGQHSHSSSCGHDHQVTWSGAALGLTLHSLIAGVALAASVEHGAHGLWLAGFSTFLVIFLHKPFDSMTIAMLMSKGSWSLRWHHLVNGLFALMVPLGAGIFYLGIAPQGHGETQSAFLSYALAFSAGTFLCISMSDLLPELQFHQHDRGKLSAALLLGLAVAYAASRFEEGTHQHAKPSTSTDISQPESLNPQAE